MSQDYQSFSEPRFIEQESGRITGSRWY